MIYTSYFANLRNLPTTITPISICAFAPKWFNGENILQLAPSRELLSDYKTGRCTVLDYWDRYNSETLSKLDPIVLYNELTAKGTPDIALLCYETPVDFCHRHILAHWLTQSGVGGIIREYGNPEIIFGG